MPPRLSLTDNERTRALALRARHHLLITLPLAGAIIAIYIFRVKLFGIDKPIKIGASIALFIVVWEVARELRRALLPRLYRLLPPSQADIISFAVRLAVIAAAVIAALRLAGVTPKAVLFGGLVAAGLLTIAAQQTLGNLIAGIVLLAARPFEVGESVHFVGQGQDVEGEVIMRGLIYVACRAEDGETILLPNSTVLSMSVRYRQGTSTTDRVI